MKKFLVNLFITLILFSTLHAAEKGTVYIFAPLGYNNEKLFDMEDTIYNRDDCMRPFYELRQVLRMKGYDLKTTILEENLEDFSGLIVCYIGDKEQLEKLAVYPQDKIIALLLEPPMVCPQYYQRWRHDYFGKIFTMLDTDLDGYKYFKLHYPQKINPMITPLSFQEKKLVTMVIGAGKPPYEDPNELYSERKKVIDFFEQEAPQHLDFYGKGWDAVKYKTYKGSCFNKIETIKNYKFCFCYENTKEIYGYVTEKIFDVMMAGCVPIYWGAKNIETYVPKECFICREDFSSTKELYDFLLSLNSEQHQVYLDAIKKFLTSEQAYLFSQDYFIETMLQALEIK